jgi:hypothetical protein
VIAQVSRFLDDDVRLNDRRIWAVALKPNTRFRKLKLMKISFAAFGIGLALTCTGQSFAQRPKPRANRPARKSQQVKPPASTAPPMPVLPDIRHDPDVQEADVAIIANITAKELRFDVVPDSTVVFFDKPNNQTIWHADRYNLPDKIEPGVTYRNIGIRLKITSRFADIDRIVAEALGEIPLTDDSKRDGTQQNPPVIRELKQIPVTSPQTVPASPRKGPND